MKKLLPNFKDKRVLDLGCGYGWHCIYAVENGASSVVGVDISHKMLLVAKEKTHYPQIEYRCCAIEDVDFPEESLDVILSSLALHYVADYETLIKKIYRMLKDGGSLVFTVEHPVFTAYGTQEWYYNEKGEILHFPVDNYYYEGKRRAVFLEERIIKYHRTLTTYLNTLLTNGFVINQVIEPQPPESMMDIPDMKDEMRRPMMLIVSANKETNHIPSKQNDCNFTHRNDEELQKFIVGELKPHNALITLVEYDSRWPELFEREDSRIRFALGNKALQVEHVGSTSVPKLCARPIIDMLLVVEDSADELSYVPALEASGYTLRVREPEWFEHRMFKGPDTDINLHVFSSGTSEIDRMLRFRDWLRSNESDRDKYAQVKRSLAKNKWRHVQHYADAKTSIVQEIMERANAGK